MANLSCGKQRRPGWLSSATNMGLDGRDEFTIYGAPVGKVDVAQTYHFDH